MTDKELKHLSRADLIEIIYELQKNEGQLRAELEAARAELSEKELRIAEAGSIAEAVVGLTHIFESAQETADQYLAQIRMRNTDTEERCTAMLEEAKRTSAELVQQAEADMRAKQERVDREITDKWTVFYQKTDEILQAHSELSELLKRR